MKVGCGIFLVNQTNQFLVGKRTSSAEYGLPGGSVEFGERIQQAAKRELLEETGIDLPVSELKVIDVFNFISSDLHCIDFVVVTKADPLQEPKVMEPQKEEHWIWVTYEDLKHLETFKPLDVMIERNGHICYDNIPNLESLSLDYQF